MTDNATLTQESAMNAAAVSSHVFSADFAPVSEPGAIVVTRYMDPDGFEVTLYRRHPGDRLRRYSRKLVSR